jgi:hypothetical protein
MKQLSAYSPWGLPLEMLLPIQRSSTTSIISTTDANDKHSTTTCEHTKNGTNSGAKEQQQQLSH